MSLREMYKTLKEIEVSLTGASPWSVEYINLLVARDALKSSIMAHLESILMDRHTNRKAA